MACLPSTLDMAAQSSQGLPPTLRKRGDGSLAPALPGSNKNDGGNDG
jgi:hypothetical protein